jgi:hypothetical protein
MRRVDELLMPPPLCATARAGSSALDLRSLDENARLTRADEVAPVRRNWVTGLRGCGEASSAVAGLLRRSLIQPIKHSSTPQPAIALRATRVPAGIVLSIGRSHITAG